MSISQNNAKSHYPLDCECGNETIVKINTGGNINNHKIWLKCGQCGKLNWTKKKIN